MALLTGRQLVQELGRLGLGTWTADAVRQWIRESPPCPIAEAADQGKPHRYNLLDVMLWLRDRGHRDRGKGFTSSGSTQFLERLELVISRHVAGGTSRESLSTAGESAPPAPPHIEVPPPSAAPSFDFEGATELEAVLETIRTGKPQMWRAVEAALNERRKRQAEEGRLVPVEDLQQALDTMAQAVRNSAAALVLPLAQRIPDQSGMEERRLLIQTALDEMLRRLSAEDTVVLAEPSAEISGVPSA